MTATHRQIVVPELADGDRQLLTSLYDQLYDRQRRNLVRKAYYEGKHAARQVGTVIPPQYQRLAIVLGWAGKAVDMLADRCNLDGFVWPDGDLSSTAYGDVWEDNHLGAEFGAALVESLIHGVSFVINTVGAEGEPASLIHVKDALNATGTWNARLRRLDNLLSITSRDDDGEPDAVALYLDGRTVTAARDGGRWSVTSDTTHPWGVPAEPVVYRPRVGKPLGTSRISRPVMSLQDQGLRTVLRMEGHADVYSFPEMWLLGADHSLFKNPDGTMKSGWDVMLGRIKAIPDDDGAVNPRADVKQFRASDPKPHLDQLKQQAMLFSGETSIPLTSLGVSGMSNPTSADSYIASREDLIARAERATDDWSPALRRAVTRAIAIGDGLDDIPEPMKSVAPKWRSPIYLSRAAQADAGAKQLGAVPWLAETSVGLKLLGLSEQDIALALSERRRAEGRQVLETIRDAAERVTAGDGS